VGPGGGGGEPTKCKRDDAKTAEGGPQRGGGRPGGYTTDNPKTISGGDITKYRQVGMDQPWNQGGKERGKPETKREGGAPMKKN